MHADARVDVGVVGVGDVDRVGWRARLVDHELALVVADRALDRQRRRHRVAIDDAERQVLLHGGQRVGHRRGLELRRDLDGAIEQAGHAEVAGERAVPLVEGQRVEVAGDAQPGDRRAAVALGRVLHQVGREAELAAGERQARRQVHRGARIGRPAAVVAITVVVVAVIAVIAVIVVVPGRDAIVVIAVVVAVVAVVAAVVAIVVVAVVAAAGAAVVIVVIVAIVIVIVGRLALALAGRLALAGGLALAAAAAVVVLIVRVFVIVVPAAAPARAVVVVVVVVGQLALALAGRLALALAAAAAVVRVVVRVGVLVVVAAAQLRQLVDHRQERLVDGVPAVGAQAARALDHLGLGQHLARRAGAQLEVQVVARAALLALADDHAVDVELAGDALDVGVGELGRAEVVGRRVPLGLGHQRVPLLQDLLQVGLELLGLGAGELQHHQALAGVGDARPGQRHQGDERRDHRQGGTTCRSDRSRTLHGLLR